jgi:hypothetical protein
VYANASQNVRRDSIFIVKVSVQFKPIQGKMSRGIANTLSRGNRRVSKCIFRCQEGSVVPQGVSAASATASSNVTKCYADQRGCGCEHNAKTKPHQKVLLQHTQVQPQYSSVLPVKPGVTKALSKAKLSPEGPAAGYASASL